MEKDFFVGRQYELKKLRGLFEKKASSLVVIQGRRRIGKSRLIREFSKNYRNLTFIGLPPVDKITSEMQLDEFTKQLCRQIGLPFLKLHDWTDAFDLLAREVTKGKVVITFDEISWMGSKDPLFLGKLKNAWDERFKNNPELILILSGSISSWIEDNILSSTGFLGRISLVLNLQELSLPESSLFLDKLGFKSSSYEKLMVLSVTGGVPRYLEEIKGNLSAAENIKQLCFTYSGILYREFEDIFSDLFDRRKNLYKSIVKSLVDSSKSIDYIADFLNIKKGGDISEYLEHLIKAGFVQRDNTWNIKTRKDSRLMHYRLSDNYLRFYLKYIEPNKDKISKGHFIEGSMSQLSGYDTIMGLQFENLILNNRHLLWQKLNINRDEVLMDNPYFQRQTQRHSACQVDYMIQTKYNILYLCEIKFSRNSVTNKVVEELEEKAHRVSLPRGYAIRLILIHINGISGEFQSDKYPLDIIDFSELV